MLISTKYKPLFLIIFLLYSFFIYYFHQFIYIYSYQISNLKFLPLILSSQTSNYYKTIVLKKKIQKKYKKNTKKSKKIYKMNKFQ
jgi:hypothetical protein